MHSTRDWHLSNARARASGLGRVYRGSDGVAVGGGPLPNPMCERTVGPLANRRMLINGSSPSSAAARRSRRFATSSDASLASSSNSAITLRRSDSIAASARGDAMWGTGVFGRGIAVSPRWLHTFSRALLIFCKKCSVPELSCSICESSLVFSADRDRLIVRSASAKAEEATAPARCCCSAMARFSSPSRHSAW